MKTQKIKIGVIGTGGISGVHLDYLKSLATAGNAGPASSAPSSRSGRESPAVAVEVAALCDINPKNLDARLRKYGGAGFDNYERMLDSVKLDAVWLCTPPQVRFEPLIACADRGIPVFCEKPVARRIEDARKTAAALRKRKAKVQIGYVFRSMPIIQRLVREIADDQICLIRSFYGCDVSLSCGLPAWFYRKELSGGALVDQATHNLDLFRMLMGEVAVVRGVCSNPVCRKSANYSVDEVLSLSFIFKNGAVGGHTHTWVGDGWRNEMDLVGKRAVYRLNLGAGTLTIEQGSESRTFRQDQSRMYVPQNRIFLEMVASGNWKNNPCTFDEGVASLDLVLKSDKALAAR